MPLSQPQVEVQHSCRFAPSPNGLLHRGHAYSALINQAWAAASGARLLVRMEDIDPDRCMPDFEAAILDDLAWLGIAHDGIVLRQSERFVAYADALQRLRKADLVYPCFCSRGQIAQVVATVHDWPRDPDGSPLYPGTCRRLPASQRAARLAAGEPAGWRLDLRAALAQTPEALTWVEYGETSAGQTVPASPADWGDALLARKSVPTSYHLAVVVDDAAQSITDVLRGEDLRPATGLHRLMQTVLGLPEPRYHHHRLVLDDQGRKLSKSLRSQSLQALRASGITAAALRGELGFPQS